MNFDEYQAQAIQTAIYPPDSKIIYSALGLTGEIGEVAEKALDIKCPATQRDVLGMTAHGGQVANQVKKVIRDDGGSVTLERKTVIGRELGGCLWYMAALAHDLDLSLADIAQENLDILADRQKRGKIQGDGDER